MNNSNKTDTIKISRIEMSIHGATQKNKMEAYIVNDEEAAAEVRTSQSPVAK